MIDILPLAFGSAIYPTLLTAVIIFLGQDDPRRLLIAYLSAALIVSVGVGLAIVAALEGGHIVGAGSSREVGPGVDIAVGLLLLFLCSVIVRRRGRAYERFAERRARRKAAREESGRDPWSERLLARDSVWMVFLVGLVLNLPGAFYLIALKDIAAADQSTAAVVLQVLVYNMIMFLLAEVPLIGFLFAPEATRRRVIAFNAWLGRNGARIAIVLSGAAGAILIARGVISLL